MGVIRRKKRFFVIKDGRISYFHTLRDEVPLMSRLHPL